jgi:secreted Zn-dependent insulinase-like peptidase
MNFVIETPLPLGEIVPLVKAQLTSLERRETKKTKPSFAEITGSLPMQVKITMDDTERYLRLYFPLLSRGNYHQSAAAEYVEYLLEQHQPDTLANNLDSFKYGRDFSVNLEEHDDLQFIVVDYDLFYQGGENYWQVMRRLFSYVDLLKKGVAEKWRFDEFLKKQATKWCYRYRSEVDQLSYNLSRYPLEYVIGKGYGADEFQPEDYLGILNAINVDNMLQVVVHPDFSLSEKSKWLDVAYEANRLSQSERDAFRPTENYYLALPKANPYIFDTVRLVGSDLNTLPKRIDSGVNVTSYIAQNTIYKSPDAFLYVKLSAPVIDQSARNSAGIDLWLSLMERQIGRDISMALAADTKFDIERETNGIVFYIQGTTKAIDLLLEKVLSPIKAFKEKERDFEGYRYGWKDYLSKTESFHPLDLSFRLRHQFLAGPSFSMKERSRAMENVSYPRVISLLEDWRENMLATVMAHGNVTDADLVRWSRSIADATVEHKGVVSVEEVVTVLPKGVHRVIDETTNTDSVIRTLVQGWDDSPEEEVRMRLLSMFLSERFFNELRTERQLGYVIRANRIQYSKTPGLEFVIQSPSAGPDQLDKQILQFFASYAEKLPKMKAEEFSNYQNALLKSLTDDPERLFGVVNRHWRGIVDNQGDFSRHDAISKAISQLTHEKFSQWFISRFVSENRRILSILIEGDKHKLSRSWKAENKETLVSSKESLLKSAEVREYVLSNSAVSVVTGENSQP